VREYRQVSALQGVRTLFGLGTTGGLSDGELLGLFTDHRGEPAELAFAALVERHGSMVLRVCRSVLHNDHDVQDAFQATFLILVRRAGAVRKRESVGSWLHGVALRVSACARTAEARRRRHEQRAAEMEPARSAGEPDAREIAAVLHHELGRLPERYRAAVVLCYLEGLTCEAAALRLGWPVGTVKSRLARGRERLLRRLIRRGLGPEGTPRSHPASRSLMPLPLMSQTVHAMVTFGAGRATPSVVSATALSWTVSTLRSMQMNRLVVITTALFVGLGSLGAVVFATQKQESVRQSGSTKMAALDRELEKPIVPARKAELITVRVVTPMGEGVPNVAVQAVELVIDSQFREYRTGKDGRCHVHVEAHSHVTELHARTEDRALGWARISRGDQSATGTDKNPVEIVLLPRSHHVEGLINDSAGKPIAGVQVRVLSVNHESNGQADDRRGDQEGAFLGSALTNETGRYTMALPENTHAILGPRHLRYFGPHFPCPAGASALAPITLEDAGGIMGTVTDSSTAKPVENARVGAHIIEHGALRPVRYGLPQGGEGGEANTDAHGRFVMHGLGPGVFNVFLLDSGKGKKFTARAVEGVRVKAGDDARADLVIIEGRRLHGTVTDFAEEKPMADIPVQSYNPARPRSGSAELGTTTDDSGNFELFVPPGSADVYCRGHYKHRTVVADRDPDPIDFRKARGPTVDYYEKSPDAIEVEARIRVRSDTDDGRPRKDRELTGVVFDQHGLPIVGVHVSYNMRTIVQGATDRMGLFRLKGLQLGPFNLAVVKNGYTPGWATIPFDAHEIELTLSIRPEAPD
jgi:RNA polymerase sigma factor (sigma-70 family)